MKNIKLILFGLCITINSFGQKLQNANWCFGTHARLDFNSSPPVATTCAIDLTQIGGTYSSGSVSDHSGNLLFFTNGATVWGKNNIPMPNGTQLWGDIGHQNIIIVPKPYQNGIYYIFTSCEFSGPSPLNGHMGIYYTVVDMSLNNSNGDVVVGLKNIPLKNQDGTLIDYDVIAGTGLRMDLVKMTTALSGDRDKIWATFFVKYTENGILKRYVYSYLVSENGIDIASDGISPQPTASTLIDNNNYPGQSIDDPFGDIKISPNGAFMCDASAAAVNLYNFDNQAGTVTFNQTLYIGIPSSSSSGYGVEFSPNSQLLYFSTYNSTINQGGRGGTSTSHFVLIYQNIVGEHTTEIIGKFSADIEGTTDNIIPIPANHPYGLQLAVDHKIYVCITTPTVSPTGWLGAINQPDIPSTACNFIPDAVQLYPGTLHWFGLPQWVYEANGRWPKSYAAWNSNLNKDNLGNIFCFFHSGNMLINVNHTGVLPSGPGNFAVQYNVVTGVTSWVKPDIFPVISLNSGDIHMLSTIDYITTSYYNGTTGLLSPPPSIVPTNELIVAETNNGGFITISSNGINVHTNTSSSTIPFINSATYVKSTFFNPNSGKLFVEYSYQFGSNTLAVYQLANNILALINNPTFSDSPGENILLVNNNDIVYTYKNSQVQQYDYINKTTTPINIPGFNNTDIYGHFLFVTRNRYTDDNLLVIQHSESKFYSINTLTSQVKKIPFSYTTVPSNDIIMYDYIYSGDDLYLSGKLEIDNNNFLTIGSQAITVYPYPSSFITKLSLSNDFESRNLDNFVTRNNMYKEIPLIKTASSESEQIQVFPNPSNTQVTITSGKTAITQIRLSDIYNNIIFQKKFSDSKNLTFSVNNLTPGVYYCSIKSKIGIINKKIVVIR